MWTARRILKELADTDLRRKILAAFWRHGDQHARAAAIVQLARAMHFRDETVRKMPPEKKADLLAARIGAIEFDQYLDMALMQYHTHQASDMMAAFLDAWNVPHDKGSIEADDYTPPTAEQVREAVNTIGASYDRRAVLVYLASAGLLMEGAWQDGAWPVVDELKDSV